MSVETLEDGVGQPALSSVVAANSHTTRQKRAVAAALDELKEFTSAQELYARLCANGTRVGVATIYNQLRFLVQHGQLDCVRNENGEFLYRRCRSTSDHYLLVCRDCGAVRELHAPEIELWAKRVGPAVGFGDLDKGLELSGICDACRQPPSAARTVSAR